MISIKNIKKQKKISGQNRVADIGVIFAGFALIFDTIPVAGYFLLGAGLLMSVLGLIKKPRTSAWIGILLSLIAVLPLLLQANMRTK